MAPRRSAAMQRAIALIQRVCDIAAPRNYLAETREYLLNAGIVAAVANHDTAALYRWLMETISYQGIANRVASDYLDRHGRVQWADVENGLRRPDPCKRGKFPGERRWIYAGAGRMRLARGGIFGPGMPRRAPMNS